MGMLEVVEAGGEGAVASSGVAQATLGGIESRGAKGLPMSTGCVRLGSIIDPYGDEWALTLQVLSMDVRDSKVDVDVSGIHADWRKGGGESTDLRWGE